MFAPACAAPVPILPAVPASGMTFGPSTQNVHAPTPCAGADGSEVAFSYTPTERVDLLWSVDAAGGFDAVAYIRAGHCDGTDGMGTPLPDAACANFNGAGGAEALEWRDAVPGTTYYFFVDGLSPTDKGDFQAFLDTRIIAGEGDDCGPFSVRCDDGLVCDLSLMMPVCVTATAFCVDTALGTLTSGATGVGNTTGMLDNLRCGNYMTSEGTDGPDQHWRLVADSTGGTYSIQAVSTDTPLHFVALYRAESCVDSSTTSQCTTGDATSATFDVALLPGGSTYVIVDSLFTSDATGQGPYTIRADKVTFLAAGSACDPALSRTVRCPSGQTCDPTSLLCSPACGNGQLDPGEVCDDGATTAGDGCSAACQVELAYTVAVEAEANDTPATAQVLPAGNVLLAGSRAGTLDVDYYKVTLAKGAILTVETLDGATSTCADFQQDSQLRVLDAAGATELGFSDRKHVYFDRCAYAAVPIAAAGDYIIEVTAAAISYAMLFDYTLRVFVHTPVFGAAVAEAEPNDSPMLAQGPFSTKTAIAGALSSLDDNDFSALTVPAGFRLMARTQNGATDTCTGDLKSQVTVFDATMFPAVLATDNGEGTCSVAQYNVNPGHAVPVVTTFSVSVSASPMAPAAFDYSLQLEAFPR
jgi:cysteine-rich repeat protein